MARLMSSLVAVALVAACGSPQQATPTAPSGPTPKPAPTAAPTPAPTAAPTLAPSPAPSAAPGPALELSDLAQFRAAMRPEFAADVDGSADLTRYAIDVTVTVNAGRATLAGREHVLYTNRQTVALPDIVFMLWPAEKLSGQYLSRMALGRVTVDGSEARPQMENDGLTARIALPAPLAPGARAELSAEFTVEARTWLPGSGGRFGISDGVLLAPTFYPLIPRLVDGRWQTLPAPPGGDTTNSDSALYVWRVTAPADQVIVGSGSVVSTTTTGQTQTQTLVTGPMRDLALVVGPLRLTSRTADGVTLNAYLVPEHADKAASILDAVAGQLRTLEAEVGPYPYAELDLVGYAASGGFGGFEYPGEVFIDVGQEGFVVATVHEVGHQWFYGLIGDDQLLQPWLDEAATSYTEVLYAEKTDGRAAARGVLRGYQDQMQYTTDPEQPIGLGIADYPSALEYGVIVYVKGTFFFDALRRQLGSRTFFAFLRAYYERYRYGFVSSQDFQATAETTCACDLGDLFDLWVYQRGAMPAN